VSAVISNALRAALLVALIVLTGSASVGQETVTIRVASAPDDDVTPLLYAQSTGMFAKAGLNVVVSKMNSGAAISAAVVGGSIDIGKSSLIPLIGAHARGVPITLVAPAGEFRADAPVTALLVLNGSPIVSARDLAGKTIAAAALKDLYTMAAQEWIARHGGDAASVHFLELPPTSMLAALVDGRVDAAATGNPVLAQAIASGKVRVLAYPNEAIAKRFLTAAWFASDDYLARNAAVVQSFAGVLSRAAAFTNAHPAATVELVAAFSGIDAGTVAHMTRAPAGAALDPAEIAPIVALAAKYKLIDHAFDPAEFIRR
jgi:NitT/TauT family transport system substrate-binding protein